MKLPLARSYFPQTIDRIHRGVRLRGFVKGRHGSSSLETIVLRNAYTQLTTFSSEFRSESKLPLLHATESSVWDLRDPLIRNGSCPSCCPFIVRHIVFSSRLKQWSIWARKLVKIIFLIVKKHLRIRKRNYLIHITQKCGETALLSWRTVKYLVERPMKIISLILTLISIPYINIFVFWIIFRICIFGFWFINWYNCAYLQHRNTGSGRITCN